MMYMYVSNSSLHRLRKEYELIADKALTTPTDTEHLMTLKEEIAKAVEKTLPELETRIIEARHRYFHVHVFMCVCMCVCIYMYMVPELTPYKVALGRSLQRKRLECVNYMYVTVVCEEFCLCFLSFYTL